MPAVFHCYSVTGIAWDLNRFQIMSQKNIAHFKHLITVTLCNGAWQGSKMPFKWSCLHILRLCSLKGWIENASSREHVCSVLRMFPFANRDVTKKKTDVPERAGDAKFGFQWRLSAIDRSTDDRRRRQHPCVDYKQRIGAIWRRTHWSSPISRVLQLQAVSAAVVRRRASSLALKRLEEQLIFLAYAQAVGSQIEEAFYRAFYDVFAGLFSASTSYFPWRRRSVK